MFLQELVNGIVLGASYALIALGFSLVYGAIRLINFAQISLYTLGAYIALFLMPRIVHWMPHQGWLALCLTTIVAGLLTALAGVVVAVVAWWPIRKAPVISMVVSSLAVLILIESLIEVFISPQPMVVNAPVQDQVYQLFGTHFSLLQLIILGTGVVLTGGLYLVIRSTRLGRAIRAVASNPDSATVLGVNVNFTVFMIFAIAAMLAGIAGVLVSNTYGVASFTMGELIGLKGFTAAVLGGMGTLWGSVVGGLALGVIEAMATFILPSQWTPAVAFAVLIIVLALRPTGILSNRATASVDRA